MMNKNFSESDETAHPEPEFPHAFTSLIDVDVFAMTDRGHVRDKNEDHYLVVRAGRNLETIFSNLTENRPGNQFDETVYGLVVADGVGGLAAGEVASREAIFGLLNLALRTPDWQFRWGSRERNTIMWRMRDRFRRVNAALIHQATAHAALNGMCTTMTAALSHGRDLVIGHIGDSRAYLLRKGILRKLTRDHTVAERLLEEGLSEEGDPLVRELRNTLMQALGSNETECNPDVQDFLLASGDQLLLCTDGLTDMVSDGDIESLLNEEQSAQSACRGLVDLALSNGGRDNITVIVARYAIP
jgi:serine/threonine protein phosphatase PrpC